MIDQRLTYGRFGMTRGAYYVSLGLAVLLIFALGFDVIVWNKNRSLEGRVAANDAARVAEKRATITAAYGRCVASIQTTKQVNRIINAVRQNLLDQAEASIALSRFDTDPALHRRRIKIAADRREEAAKIRDFPRVTKQQCDARRLADLREVGLA
jgi:hypothetical protein